MSEMQALFGAEPCGRPTREPLIWPGERVVAVTERNCRRMIDTQSWGLPAAAFVDSGRSRAHRAILFPRDAGELERCLSA